jgi:hypothetical protein
VSQNAPILCSRLWTSLQLLSAFSPVLVVLSDQTPNVTTMGSVCSSDQSVAVVHPAPVRPGEAVQLPADKMLRYSLRCVSRFYSLANTRLPRACRCAAGNHHVLYRFFNAENAELASQRCWAACNACCKLANDAGELEQDACSTCHKGLSFAMNGRMVRAGLFSELDLNRLDGLRMQAKWRYRDHEHTLYRWELRSFGSYWRLGLVFLRQRGEPLVCAVSGIGVTFDKSA